jgi:molybdenum cofactor cytidylyltransferase
MSIAVAAIVLAAGESSRMGRPKPLLPLNGETFLRHLLAEIRASRVTRTVVVLGYRPEVVLAAMPEVAPFAIVNPNYPLGQLSSFRVGLDAVADSAEAALLCLADHPFISGALIDALILAHERTQRPIIVPTHGGRRGHPTLFAAALFDELRAAPLDQGARVVVRAHADQVLELPTEEAGVVADIDTPEQYQQWLAHFRGQGTGDRGQGADGGKG